MASQYSIHLFVEEATNNSWSNMYRYIPAGSRVLDVGCSTGNFGEVLENLKQCTVVGVDINAVDIAEASTKISAAHVLDITRDRTEELGTFDVVLFADVLEHMPEPRDAMRAVHSLLNDGGKVVYSIPHMGHLSVRLDLLEGRFPYTELGLLDRTHLRYYDRLEIADVFSSTGFTIVEENPVVVGHPDPWTAERLELMGLRASEQFFRLMKLTDADIYQYVGVAVRSSESPRASLARDAPTPPDVVLEHANRVIAENERLRSELDALRQWIIAIRRNPVLWLARKIARKLFRSRG